MYRSTHEEIDFNKLYAIQKKASSSKNKDSKAWDERAFEMNEKIHVSSYNEVIAQKVDLSSASTLLDVGCGPGTFSLRFAPHVKEVFAFDFSPMMLSMLRSNAQTKGIGNITSITADIEGDWSDIPICDVVLASRCLEVDDLQKALTNLDLHAKQAVYLTFKVGKGYLSEELVGVLGRKIVPKPDYIYVLNILYNMGILATLDFIFPQEKVCCEKEGNLDAYLQAIIWSLGELGEEEIQRVKVYFEMCQKEKKVPALRDNRWALISWKK